MPRLSTALPIPPRNVPVPKHTLVRIVSVIAVLLVGHTIAVAQTVPGDAARGQGSYLNGLGWYNLNTAKANSINVDATIRWKQDLRQIQLDRWDLVANQNAKKAAGKKLKIEEVKYQQLVRLRQLRVEPTAADVETGDALNVLLYDLTDPDISQESWSNTSQAVKLPEGMSVKDLVFRFTSLKGSSATSAALSKGVIALSRLAVAGDKWPTPLQVPEIQKERAAYEAAYAKVRDQILAGQFDLKAVQAMDRSLDALNEKVKTAVPAERGFRTEAAKFVSDLKDSTRMFDAATVDYAREILNDTKDHDATTVAELVAFMLKYRLQFASAERSPEAREIYTPLFEKLKEQHKAFGITVPEVPEMLAVENGPSFFNGKDLTGWRGLPAIWSIRDGSLVGLNKPGELKFNTCLVSETEFGDFELQCNVKLSDNPLANSGIQFRSQLVDLREFQVHGPQCDLKAGAGWGSLYGEGTGMIQEANAVAVSKVLKPGEFNQVFVRCVGKRVTIKINGLTTVDKQFSEIAARGVIGWQVHRGNVGEIVFKDIEFKELP